MIRRMPHIAGYFSPMHIIEDWPEIPGGPVFRNNAYAEENYETNLRRDGADGSFCSCRERRYDSSKAPDGGRDQPRRIPGVYVARS